MNSELVQVRVTGVLIEEGNILIVKQTLSEDRKWSLPGGRVQSGETLEQGMTREMWEETGLNTRIRRLLYVCDKTDVTPSLIHVTFLLERTGGTIRLPDNQFDQNPIHDVGFVPISDLKEYGFSEKFMRLAAEQFPESGSYMGDKANIGL